MTAQQLKNTILQEAIEIETYMAAIGFTKQNDKGKYANNEFIV